MIRANSPAMKSLQAFLFSSLALLAFAAPAAAVQDSSVQSRRESIIELAESFASVTWTAEERHFFHGDDESGVRIDTPDVALDEKGFKVGPGNVGMPYCWGGFTSLETFESELADSRWAGHVPNRGNAMGSSQTIGVDCSGLVSRCWSLPAKQSTRSLGALCYELDDYDQLMPGDIVNRFDAHVAIFTGWADEERTKINVIEAARLRVEESVYEVSVLRKNNFLPMRYKPLDERWWPMPAALDLEGQGPRAQGRFESEVEFNVETSLLPLTFRKGETAEGTWVRYAASEGMMQGPSVTCTWMAVNSTERTLTLQRRLHVGTDTLDTGATLILEEQWAKLLSTFGNFSDPLQDLEVVSQDHEYGTYRSGKKKLVARRMQATITGNLLSRSTLYPFELSLDCVISDDVPLLGICKADMTLDIDYGGEGEKQVIGRAKRSYELIDFGPK